jgi:hypothetical protein
VVKEDRGQKTEVRSQKSEVISRRQKAGDDRHPTTRIITRKPILVFIGILLLKRILVRAPQHLPLSI